MSYEQDTRWLTAVSRSVRNFPADLAVIVGYVLLATAVVLVPAGSDIPQVLIGLPLLFFLPGYVLLAALFPAASTAEKEPAQSSWVDGVARARELRTQNSVDGVERLGLSFGVSIAILPFIGMAAANDGFDPERVLAVLGGFIAVCSVVGAYRRLKLPREDQFAVPFGSWVTGFRRAIFDTDSIVERFVNVAVVLGVIAATSTLAYAVAVPADGESFTDVTLVTENNDGEFVASGYPTEFVRDESQPLVVALENQEGESMTYTVVVQVERVRGDGSSATIVETKELQRFKTTVGDGDREFEHRDIAPSVMGTDLRLSFLVYTGDAPTDANAETAYRHVHLWITVTDGE